MVSAIALDMKVIVRNSMNRYALVCSHSADPVLRNTHAEIEGLNYRRGARRVVPGKK
jgi:hypothetical protein